MRVCIDIQSAVAQQAGVGRYTRQLVRHLGAHAGAEDELRLFYFDFLRGGEPFGAPGAGVRRLRLCPGRAAQALWRTVGWPPFDRFAGAADVYHFPNFVLPPLRRGRGIVTIHDVSFLRYPQFADERNLRFLSARIRETARRAAAVITDSRFCAAEIRDLLGADPERVFAVHLGVGDEFHASDPAATGAALRSLGVSRPYLLAVGTLEPRKNHAFLVEVFEKLAAFDGRLVVAGMRGWKYEPILERLRASARAADIVYLDYVPEKELPALYTGAEVLVLPSHYEGFGLPPLEAMACGTPVVSSAAGALREVLGDAAVVLDGFDAEAWCDAIGRVLSDTGLRAGLIARGRARAAALRWPDTAARTWNVYRRVAAGG